MTFKNKNFESILKEIFKFVIEKYYQVPIDDRYKIFVHKKTSGVDSDVYLCKAYIRAMTPVCLYAKHGKDYEVLTKKEYDLMLSLWVKHYQKEKYLCIPKPIYYSQDANILFTERIDGITLAKFLHYKAAPICWHIFHRKIMEHVKRAAIWLKSFHTITRQPIKLSLESALENDLESLHQHQSACLSKELFEQSLSKLYKLAKNLNLLLHYKTGRHGDYSIDNIIVSHEKTSAIDFAQFNYGTPLYDVAKFMVLLDIYGNFIYHNTNFFRSLATVFLTTYNESNRIVSFSEDDVKIYKPIILLHELKWTELFEQELPSKNPFLRYTIYRINKYAIKELKNFIGK